MKTEYGTQSVSGEEEWWEGLSRDEAAELCKKYDCTLIAREVSEPRVVSIRG